jgi:hypothetical protein
MSRLLVLVELVLSLFIPSAFAEFSTQKVYNELFPYYAEVCGFTRMDGGGPGGHAVIYLRGACRDQDASYPRVKLCSEEGVDRGTVLSVDRSFRNVEWVGIEDHDFGLYGGLELGEPLSDDVFLSITNEAYRSRAFRGIRAYDVADDLPEEAREYLIAHGALSTDYAINFARKGSCWKIPLAKAQLQAMVTYANDLNDSHQEPENPYRWNALGNNCTHFIVNLLASAGILREVKTGAIFPENVFRGLPMASFRFITPSSLVAEIGAKVERRQIPGVEKAFWEIRLRKSLLEFGRLPFQDGVILETMKFHQEGNAKFRLRSGRMGKPGDRSKIEEMEQDSDLKNLTLNLVTYYGLYEKAYQNLASLDEIQKNRKSLNTDEFRDFYQAYSEWLARSLEEIKEKLSVLGILHAEDSSLAQEN